jgi:hypothetical protein
MVSESPFQGKRKRRIRKLYWWIWMTRRKKKWNCLVYLKIYLVGRDNYHGMKMLGESSSLLFSELPFLLEEERKEGRETELT